MASPKKPDPHPMSLLDPTTPVPVAVAPVTTPASTTSASDLAARTNSAGKRGGRQAGALNWSFQATMELLREIENIQPRSSADWEKIAGWLLLFVCLLVEE